MKDSELKKRRHGKHKPLVRQAGPVVTEKAPAPETMSAPESVGTAEKGRYRQLEIWWVSLGGKTTARCVVLQSDRLNDYAKTTLVIPLWPGHSKRSYTVNIEPSGENGLEAAMHLNLTRVQAVAGKRLERQVGALEAAYESQIRWALHVVIGFGS